LSYGLGLFVDWYGMDASVQSGKAEEHISRLVHVFLESAFIMRGTRFKKMEPA
jgi:hypothetical protein